MRTFGMLLICAFLSWIGPHLGPTSAPAVPLDCQEIISTVDSNDAEWLVCLDGAMLEKCPETKPGRRYRGCEELGPIRGPVLAFRGRLIEVNLASEEDLRVLPKVGEGLARRIIEGRRDAPYCGQADLQRVNGIGTKTAARIGEYLSFAHPLCEISGDTIK